MPLRSLRSRLTFALGISALALAAPAGGAVLPAAEVTFDDSYCGVAPHPLQHPADTVPATLRSFVDVGNGRTAYAYGCGLFDGYVWGPLQQEFAGFAGVVGFGEVGPGWLRVYGEAFAKVDPFFYRPPGFITGDNPYNAVAQHVGGASYVDLFTPPATPQAPNVGDGTTLAVMLHLRCDEQPNYLNLYTDTSVGAWFFTPAGFERDPQFGYFDSVFQHTDIVHGTLHAICDFTLTKQVAVQVGVPIVVRTGIGILASGGVASYPNQYQWDQWSNALNTATLEVYDGSGQPLAGASGHVYGPVGVLPSYTTTTSTTSTTTTLPPPGATCGDGVLDAGEACDCPHTDDPVLDGAGCSGAAVVPPQRSCVICRRCILLDHLCATAATTSTTLGSATTTTTSTVPAGGTTTTTSPGGPTTTTTLPGACAEVTGVARAACLLRATLATPLCGDEVVPPRVDARLRAKLGAALRQLTGVDGLSSRVLGRRVKRARRLLAAAAGQAAKAAAAKNPKKHVSARCAAEIQPVVGAIQAALSAPGTGA